MITVCRVIFIMCYFCHFTHSTYFVPSQAQFFLCSIIMKRKIWPVLNSSIEDALKERGENKNGEICSQRKNKNICYSFINCLDIILCIKPPFLIFLLSDPEKIYIESWKKMLTTEGHSWPLWHILCHNSGWVCWCQLTFTLSFNIKSALQVNEIHMNLVLW